jgi:hypothetical protein
MWSAIIKIGEIEPIYAGMHIIKAIILVWISKVISNNTLKVESTDKTPNVLKIIAL